LRLTLYSKPGCHLCDDMKALVHRVIGQLQSDRDTSDISIDEIDISVDHTLLDRYGLEIPVLMIDGTKVAKYRISEEELRRMLESRGKG
jgi:glutaredoxin